MGARWNILAAAMLAGTGGCGRSGCPCGGGRTETATPMAEKIVKSDQQWRKVLTPEQYRITRRKGTERAFTGAYWNTKDKGVYRCVACGQPLFDAAAKFDSGTGWPSFSAPIDERSVAAAPDRSHGMVRTEVTCSRCDAHLGHVFDDGPAPTGKRYCINSGALKLETGP